MSAAIAMAPSPAPHDRSTFVDVAPAPAAPAPLPRSSPPDANAAATTNAATIAPPSASQSPKQLAPPATAAPAPTTTTTTTASNGATTASKANPTSARNGHPPKIVVKQEPSSPVLSTARHRPRKLDLSKNTATTAARPSAGQSGGLGIQDVGIACLSPGFVTQDPAMREQLQRSISVREQQRHIIESRLQQNASGGPSDGKEAERSGTKTAGLRGKAPPGLRIVAPSHEQFANERMIQSAPLNQTFTGRHQPHPLTRHVANQPTNLSSTSHIHHGPAHQTNNRLPPITDVFASEGLGQRDQSRSAYYPPSAQTPSQPNPRYNFPSPGHAPAQPPHSARPREYRSAEEAQAEMTGGRPELLPRLVHYNGHQQPPTPPSPLGSKSGESSRPRRRTRAEYEEGVSPPLGTGPSARRGPFGEGRDSPESQRRKKEEFIRLCERAWDLFHS